MIKRETILYSPQLATLYIEHVKITARICREAYDFSYNEFATLLALHETQDGVLVADITDFLLLERASVWNILIDLEDKQLITKTDSDEDGRLMRVALSDAGSTTIIACKAQVYEALTEAFWSSLPVDEYRAYMQNTIRLCLDSLRGYTVPKVGSEAKGSTIFLAESFVFWRAMIDEWKRCAKYSGDLLFNELRALHLLNEMDQLTSKDIAIRLLLPKSTVSSLKESLEQKKFITLQNDTFDKRAQWLRITKAGTRVTQKVTKELDKITDAVHYANSDVSASVISAWHSRMYSNYRSRLLINS